MSFGGDILIHDRLREIPRRFPDVGLTLLHRGGIEVLGIMATLDAEQGVEAKRIIDLAPAPHPPQRYTIFGSPLEDFKRIVTEAGSGDLARYLAHAAAPTSFRSPPSRGNLPALSRVPVSGRR